MKNFLLTLTLFILGTTSTLAQEVDNVSVTFPPEGFVTYYDSGQELVLAEYMKAYIVTFCNTPNTEGTFTLVYRVIAEGEGGIVPAGTAVLLQMPEGVGTYDIGLRPSDGSSSAPANNLLRGFDASHLTEGGDIYYKLTYGTTVAGANVLGWFWGEENGEAFESQAHKAYLPLPAGAFARFAPLPDYGDISGIADADADPSIFSIHSSLNNAWYTLDGRRLDSAPTRKGVYVHNGRAVVVK